MLNVCLTGHNALEAARDPPWREVCARLRSLGHLPTVHLSPEPPIIHDMRV